MGNKKYKIRKDGRIVALQDFGDILAGDVGGYVQYEHNLSHEGLCWVFGDARVSGDAEVYGNARVSGDASVSDSSRVFDNARVFGDSMVCDDAEVFGNAEVFGDAIAKTRVLTCTAAHHPITVTDTHTIIGCKCHTHEYWMQHIESIGKEHEYTQLAIAEYKAIVFTLIQQKQLITLSHVN
jgi:hypothetical protein